jgi:cyclic beta-1,2-glucan synthetase
VLTLRRRLDDNAATLLAAYRASAAELENGRGVVPAAEWLLDNYHLVEEQIREIRADLPPGYYRQLPKLAAGPFAGYPRVFGLAWAFVAHTDSHFDPGTLRSFIAAYQRVQPLTIGELWAVAITLRIVLIEKPAPAGRPDDGRPPGRGSDAQALADRLLTAGNGRSALQPTSRRAHRSAVRAVRRAAGQAAARPGPAHHAGAALARERLKLQAPRSTRWWRMRTSARARPT